MDSLQYCVILVKQIIKSLIGVELSDQEAESHAKELESQLREEFTEAGSPGGLSEKAFVCYIQEKANTNLTILID